VVFAGAGSHSSYFEQGEYKMTAQPEFFQPIKRAAIRLRKFWEENLGQGKTETVNEEVSALFKVPFIDYARGDGVCIGPGQARAWTPILLTEEMGWAEHYRGLWGLDTRDQLGGERAPAGPKYNRNGSVRLSWYNPLGWAGLDKVPPPGQVAPQLLERLDTLNMERAAVQQQLEEQREKLRLLNLEVRSLRETEYLDHIYQVRAKNLEADQAELQALYDRYISLTETWKATQSYLEKVEHGNWGHPQAHLKRKPRPEPPVGKQARITELWAALSSGLLLLVFTVLLVFDAPHWFYWTISMGIFFLTLEAMMRGQLGGFLLNITIGLALIIALIFN
jgi:hypothetical protein